MRQSLHGAGFTLIEILVVLPITGSWETWLLIPPDDPQAGGNVYDIRSGSPDVAEDGSYYADW